MENIDFLQQYHCMLTEQNIILAYGGEIQNGVVSNIMSLIDNNMNLEKNNLLKKRVLQVVVECIQNIERHAGEFLDAKRKASFLVFKKDNEYMVSFCNHISNSNIDGLKAKIDKINSFTKEELSSFYKTSLRENTISDKGGAGLGLIEISRKSGSKINYVFKKIDDVDSTFSLMVKIA
jgi:hypothetical protein